MTERRHRSDWLRAGLLALVVAGGIPTVQGFRQDEIECEEAVAYLQECCEGFDPKTVRCDYVEGCDVNTYPTIRPKESQCIRDKSCGEVRQQGICKQVVARQHEADEAPADETFQPTDTLCQ